MDDLREMALDTVRGALIVTGFLAFAALTFAGVVLISQGHYVWGGLAVAPLSIGFCFIVGRDGYY